MRTRSHIGIQLIIGRALVDRDFCARLLSAPASVANEFELTPEEIDLLASLHADDLEQLATQVERWRSSLRTVHRETTLQKSELECIPEAQGQSLARATRPHDRRSRAFRRSVDRFGR